MSNPIKVVTSQGLIIKNIVIKGKNFVSFVKKTYEEGIDTFFPITFEKQLSQTCHTLAALAKLGHPYAARHYGNKIDPPQESIFGEGKVHIHTGELVRDVMDHLKIEEDAEKSIDSEGQLTAYWNISIKGATVPHVFYVFLGTTRHKDGKPIMVARNPGVLSMDLAMPFIVGYFFENVSVLAKKEFRMR